MLRKAACRPECAGEAVLPCCASCQWVMSAAGRGRGQAAALEQLRLKSIDGEPNGGSHEPKADTNNKKNVGENAGIDRAAGQPASLLDEMMSLPLAEPAADTLPAGELHLHDACTMMSSC